MKTTQFNRPAWPRTALPVCFAEEWTHIIEIGIHPRHRSDIRRGSRFDPDWIRTWGTLGKTFSTSPVRFHR
jgi:hypothetical protein